jgi:hypothetical protein
MGLLFHHGSIPESFQGVQARSLGAQSPADVFCDQLLQVKQHFAAQALLLLVSTQEHANRNANSVQPAHHCHHKSPDAIDRRQQS